MGKLTGPMIRLIEDFNAGSVASTNADGTPAVSPKGTFVVIDDGCIAFGNIRSPATVENLRARPDVEVNFIDVLTRRAVRLRGRAQVFELGSEEAQRLLPAFLARLRLGPTRHVRSYPTSRKPVECPTGRSLVRFVPETGS